MFAFGLAKTAIDLLGNSIYLSLLTLPLATKEWIAGRSVAQRQPA